MSEEGVGLKNTISFYNLHNSTIYVYVISCFYDNGFTTSEGQIPGCLQHLEDQLLSSLMRFSSAAGSETNTHNPISWEIRTNSTLLWNLIDLKPLPFSEGPVLPGWGKVEGSVCTLGFCQWSFSDSLRWMAAGGERFKRLRINLFSVQIQKTFDIFTIMITFFWNLSEWKEIMFNI